MLLLASPSLIVSDLCLGDIEELTDVITDSLGPQYVAETMLPRYDLAYWLGRLGPWSWGTTPAPDTLTARTTVAARMRLPTSR